MPNKGNKCCCGTEDCTACLNGSGPSHWQFILTGITAGSCSSAYCGHFNQVWTLPFIGQVTATECRWFLEGPLADPDTCFGSTTMSALLQLQTTGAFSSFILTMGVGALSGNWQKIMPATADCNVSHVLTRVGGGSFPCGNRPLSITIAPVT